MPSPIEVKSFPEKENETKRDTILLSELSKGDTAWEDRVFACSQSPDDPPVLPGWNLLPCHEFFDKAVAYGIAGGPAVPPAQIFAGAHPVGPSSPAGVQQMQLDIMNYLVSTNPGASVIGGGANGAVGLACTARQFGIACGQLGRLELQPWFLAVLSYGAPLTGKLASIYMPRSRVASGICDTIPFNCTLWT